MKLERPDDHPMNRLSPARLAVLAVLALLALLALRPSIAQEEEYPGEDPGRAGDPGTGTIPNGIRTIVLDPGHGGEETGAVGRMGLMEKDLALDIARRLRRRLERNSDLRVLLTREDDRQIPLRQRTALANNARADLFISIHLNSSRRSSAHGTETYFLALTATDEEALNLARIENLADEGLPEEVTGAPGGGIPGGAPQGGAGGDEPSDLEMVLWGMAQSEHLIRASSLAELIQGEMNRLLRIDSRGVKQAPFTVLMGATMPAVLVEVAFLSNADDEERLASSDFRDRVAAAMESAILRHKADYDRARVSDPAAPAP